MQHQGQMLEDVNPFYTIMPSWWLVPGIVIATAAAIVASGVDQRIVHAHQRSDPAELLAEGADRISVGSSRTTIRSIGELAFTCGLYRDRIASGVVGHGSRLRTAIIITMLQHHAAAHVLPCTCAGSRTL